MDLEKYLRMVRSKHAPFGITEDDLIRASQFLGRLVEISEDDLIRS